MSDRLQNVMRREGERAASQRALTRMATVTSYDPNSYAAKVVIQPEGHETGFIPVATPWVGSGWGMFCPPSPGDVVDVHFQEGGKLAAYVSLRFYGDAAQPLGVPSGEFWLVHQSGSFLKFKNDGTVLVNGAGDINVTAPNLNLTGNLNVTGDIVAGGDISDLDGASGTVAHIRTVYDSHTHSGVQTGGGTTATPNQPL
ncbi:MAG: phage baseplate assembly protein V [Planctomycetes bacterium]|nr:phage baseplate assembly protein V [Planctomycetota bacterium]